MDITLDAPVLEVTLMEDRARVVRAGRASLPAGAVRLRIGDVAPVLADKSLAVSFPSGNSGSKVLSVRAERSLRTQDRSAEAARLQEELDALDERIAHAAGAKAAIEGHIASLSQLASMTVTELAEDAGWGQETLSAAASQLENMDTREADLRLRCAQAGEELKVFQQRAEDLSRRIAEARKPSDRIRADIVIDLSVAAAGAHDLRIEYVVPGACWRPHHTARLVEGEKPAVEFTCEGCVWQDTGEEWKGVTLFFSTQRPSLGVEPPTLTSDVLSTRPKPQQVVVQARDQEIATTGLGAGPAADSLPGIDDDGAIVTLQAARKADVPSDGRPYRVPISTFSSAAEVLRVLMAEVSDAVHLKSVQTNVPAVPLLAGPVDLVRAGGFVGRTSTLYVSPGERFPLGWGPDGAIRVHREVEKPKPKEGVLSSWIAQEHKVALKVSNLGPEAREVHVTERVPVSEVEKVQIDFDADATTGKKTPDSDGFVRWTLRLGAFARETLQLAYTVKRHKDVVGL